MENFPPHHSGSVHLWRATCFPHNCANVWHLSFYSGLPFPGKCEHFTCFWQRPHN